MSTKRSQDYLYFQSKAHHYHNIKTARASVEDQLPNPINNTISYVNRRKYNRDLPLNKQHEIETQNKGLENRIVNILQKGRKQITVDGHYSRYHKFERSFRLKNPCRDDEVRQIQRTNDIYNRKMEKARSKIGNHSLWEADFKENDSIRRRMCRYGDDKGSKGDLEIEKQHFLADPYKVLLGQMEQSRSNKSLKTIDVSRASNNKSNHAKIQKQKLFILPSFSRQSESLKKLSQSNISKQEKQETMIDNKDEK